SLSGFYSLCECEIKKDSFDTHQEEDFSRSCKVFLTPELRVELSGLCYFFA
uniref:Uncharacterized protein n=1 Tax=Aegilops tauschii subsp. strangulata TaxID=200361 RepID=A0A453MIX7_AEGTS